MSKRLCLELNSIRRVVAFTLLGASIMFGALSSAFAGGFQLSVETPGGSSDSQMTDVVLVARTYGCHQPADAKLSATAEGLLNGSRKTVALDLRSIGSGVYAIKQQWPSEGTWVLAITGAYNGMTSSVLVELGPNGKVLPGTRLEEGAMKGVHAKGARRQWVAEDIDSALRTSAGRGSESGGTDGRSPFVRIGWVGAGLGASVLTIGFVARLRRRHDSSKFSS